MISGFFGFFDLIFFMAWWRLLESYLYFSFSFISSSICFFVSALTVHLILFMAGCVSWFSLILFCLFVADSASSLHFFCYWDSVLILFDVMRCCCLFLEPIVFSAAEKSIVSIILVHILCGLASSSDAINITCSVYLYLIIVSLPGMYRMFSCLLVSVSRFILLRCNLRFLIKSLWFLLLLNPSYNIAFVISFLWICFVMM